MVGDKEGRQRAMDEQEDQASFAQSGSIPGKEGKRRMVWSCQKIPSGRDLSEHFILQRENRSRKGRAGRFQSHLQTRGRWNTLALPHSSLFPG